MYGLSNSYKSFKRIKEEFQARNEISYREMREMILNTYEPFRIYGTKLDGTNIVRDVYSVDGPGGRAMNGVIYWRSPYNYMILYSQSDSGFRTFVLKNVTKIVKNGKSYIVVQ